MASIADVGGIDGKEATRLRKAGIRTAEALLKHASTRRGRVELAGRTGFTPAELLAWVHRADLMRVQGVGSEYAMLLEAVGVGSLAELCRRQPGSLLADMAEVNTLKHIVRRLPSMPMVEEWVAAANRLESLVKR